MQLKPFEFGNLGMNTHTSIDRLKTLTEELAVEDETFQVFFNESPDMLAVTEHDGTIKKINNKWCEMLGWGKLEVKSHKIFQYVHAEDMNFFRQAWGELDSRDWNRVYFRMIAEKETKCAAIEWNAIVRDGLIYAIAREVPFTCLAYPAVFTEKMLVSRRQKINRIDLE